MMDRVILSRHGESVAITEGIENGDPGIDQGLTDCGREQARELGRRIADDPVDLCVVSLFPRVQQTADLSLSGRDMRRIVDPNLNDIRYGEFEGRPKGDYTAWVQSHDLTTPLPGGESRMQVAVRLCTAIEGLLDRSEHHALVVTHELLIDDLLRATQGQPPAQLHGDIPFATPHRLDAPDVARGVTFLRSFLETLI
jgi:2,3-bisphosphoglycerate-dependent phosphoglycerate mutase